MQFQSHGVSAYFIQICNKCPGGLQFAKGISLNANIVISILTLSHTVFRMV